MAAYKFLTPNGTIVPDTADLQAEVIAEYRAAFGQDLRVSADTPQGVLITMETLTRAAIAENNAALANQINPDLAGGVFLDAVCALLGLQRRGASRTMVPGVLLTGRPLTLIPQGSRARSSAGDLFETAGAAELDATGTATVTMQAVDAGPVGAPAGSINAIVSPVLGWEGVSNPGDGILGSSEQSDASLRDQRRRTLALQGISTPEAVTSQVAALPGVRSLQFRENILSTPQTVDGIPMVPHSVWVCVDGGVDEAVALALLANKTAGAAWNGGTTVVVTEPSSGQLYSVEFDRPEEVQMLVRVTIRPGTATEDPQTVIPQAVVDYAEGRIPGEPGFVVGGAVSPFELSSAIGRAVPAYHVVLVEVAPVSTGVYQPTQYSIDLDQVARVSASSVTVVVL